jgi:hypothetical protein
MSSERLSGTGRDIAHSRPRVSKSVVRVLLFVGLWLLTAGLPTASLGQASTNACGGITRAQVSEWLRKIGARPTATSPLVEQKSPLIEQKFKIDVPPPDSPWAVVLRPSQPEARLPEDRTEMTSYEV